MVSQMEHNPYTSHRIWSGPEDQSAEIFLAAADGVLKVRVSVTDDVHVKSKTAAEIVAKLQSVRLVGCPADFVDAYKAYIKAWEKFTDIEKSLYAQNMQKGQSDVADFISTFVSNPTAAVVKLKKEWPAEADSIDKAAEGITKAFTNVTNIGTKYNAVYTRSSGLF